MPDINRTLPNNLEAEQALLGCMLIDNDIMPDVLEKLKEDDFYQPSHRLILSAMKLIFAEHRPLDLVTLTDKLEKEGNLSKSGGLTYLTELTQVTPSAANFNHYFEIVRRDATNRNLIRAAENIIKYSKSSDDGYKSVQNAESLIYAVSRLNDTSTMKDIRETDAIDAVMDKFQLLDKDKDAYRGIQTGFIKLDKLTNGLQKSDLIVIAARPGMGKTSLAMNIVESAALNNNKVCAVFSLEMPETQIIQRLLCGFANVSMAKALAGGGKLTPNDWKKLTKSAEQLRKSRIYIDDSSRIKPAEILSKCRRIKSKNNGELDLVMIDYIQLMTSDKKNAEQNRTQEVADITRELKIMAKELNVPIIALSQLRRMQTKEPQLSDLRESGAIEQDADIVMFINRPDVGLKEEERIKANIPADMADLIVAKHRNGGLDRIRLRFKGEITKFVNPEPDDDIIEPRYNQSGGYDPLSDPNGDISGDETDGSAVFSDDDLPPF